MSAPSSSFSPGSGESPASSLSTVVAVAVGNGVRSRRAVRWVARNLVDDGSCRVVLLHVIPSVSSIPSPTGRCVPVSEVDPRSVEMYVQDRKLKAQSVFYPLRRLCGTKKVETLVVDGENPATAILKYVQESRMGNLVLGSSSMGWFRRLLNGPSVPTTVLKSAPDSCNIFVVSRRKLTMKFSVESDMDGFSLPRETKIINHKAFIRGGRTIFHQELVLPSPVSGESSLLSSFSGHTLCQTSGSACWSFKGALLLPSSGDHQEHQLDNRTTELQSWKKLDTVASFGTIPFVLLHPAKEVEATAEIVRLRIELEKTLAKYNQTCEELTRARKEVQSLSAECSSESKKVKDALEREENLKMIAAQEKAKHLEAVKEVQEARELLAKEALDRHTAEIAAIKISFEKSKAANAVLSNDKIFRRYSTSEIEAATDQFSSFNKIGEGSYGDVYKCNLDHTPVAIKVLRRDASNKKDEFLREVEILGQLRHPNIVLLLGICPENGCLIYEYMENGSLEDLLFSREGREPLPWFIRFRIIFEVACGLAFLHGTKPESIIHRDLKPGNILLNRNFMSKIGDVGLAKLMSDIVPDGLTEYRDTMLAGTLFYMDPEYQRTGTVRPKSDLYALGIIALQLLTGKHPKGLVVTAENAIKGHSLTGILDKSISDWPLAEAEKLAKVALLCTRLKCRDRPDLEREVLPVLEELMIKASTCFKPRCSNLNVPSHYVCPILQEIMENPYIAADGFTYEHNAIKLWLEKHKISPITKLRISNTNVVPNYSLRAAIQEWKTHTTLASS